MEIYLVQCVLVIFTNISAKTRINGAALMRKEQSWHKIIQFFKFVSSVPLITVILFLISTLK